METRSRAPDGQIFLVVFHLRGDLSIARGWQDLVRIRPGEIEERLGEG